MAEIEEPLLSTGLRPVASSVHLPDLPAGATFSQTVFNVVRARHGVGRVGAGVLRPGGRGGVHPSPCIVPAAMASLFVAMQLESVLGPSPHSLQINIFVGIGLLSLPYAFKAGGYLSGVALLVVAVLFCLSGHLIVKAFEYLPLGVARSYPELGVCPGVPGGRRHGTGARRLGERAARADRPAGGGRAPCNG